MKLKALSLSDCEQVRQWRNEQLPMLRTSFPLTQQQQMNFYSDVVCNRQANSRYWGIVENDNQVLNRDVMGNLIPEQNAGLIGMCGLENISLENRNAEISLIFYTKFLINKYGEIALDLLLHEGFMNMNLENIYTEVYECSPYNKFWMQQANKYNSRLAILPNRKYWNGLYYDSEYINFNKERYNEI
jgi:RimJ/RimL family protein N-acetyltransferase